MYLHAAKAKSINGVRVGLDLKRSLELASLLCCKGVLVPIANSRQLLGLPKETHGNA